MSILIWLGFSCSSALADGAVFTPIEYAAKVEIPNQQAYIRFANAAEVLVIETSFLSEGTNFAWVVPLPTPPLIKPASEDFFHQLRTAFQPKLVHAVHHYYAGVLMFLAFSYLAFRSMQDELPWRTDLPLCFGLAMVSMVASKSLLLGVIVFCIAAGLRIFPRSPKNVAVCMLAGLGTTVYAVVLSDQIRLSTSTMGEEASSQTESQAAVQPISVQRAGVFESTTIRSKDPLALEQWLRANGYRLPAETRSAVEEYCKKGWVFVASKVARPDTTAVSALHPLSFTFATPEPIYPMALTGSALSNECTVDLYVVGEKRASAKYFKANRCEKVINTASRPSLERMTWIRFDDASGESITEGLVGTRLSASLSPDQMRSDIRIGWRPFWRTGRYIYSESGAFLVILNIALPLGVIGWFLIGAGQTERFFPAESVIKCRASFVGLLLLLCIGTYFWLPKTDVIEIGRFDAQRVSPAHEFAKSS